MQRALDALTREGIEVTLLCRRWSTPDRNTVLRTWIVNPFFIGRLWRDIGFARGVQQVLKKHAFDLVQSHERIPGCTIYRAGDGVHRQWLAHRAAAAGWWRRLGDVLNPWHRYICAQEKALFEHPQLRAVICNSQMVAKEIHREFNLPAARLHVIYNGVDLSAFHPQVRVQRRQTARQQFSLSPTDTVFAFVGSGFARKGLKELLQALALHSDSSQLLVAGVDRHQRRFAAQASALGLRNRVHFLGGVDAVQAVYAAADMLVLPTHYDPFPNVVLEALAMGLPAIVSDQCGAAEVIVSEKNGLIVPARDVHALAVAMQRSSQTTWSSETVRASVLEFSIESMAEKMHTLYQTLLNEQTLRIQTPQVAPV